MRHAEGSLGRLQKEKENNQKQKQKLFLKTLRRE